MKAVIFRPNHLHGSWRPCSLVDNRGPKFPEEYREVLALEVENDLFAQFERVQAEHIDGLFEEYVPLTGDILFLGDGDELMVYAAGPYGWEIVKFGSEWRSPR